MRSWKVAVALLAMICGLLPLPGWSAIIITGTRVIYPESSREVNVRLTNVSDSPVLVQSWIDDGHENASPDKIEVPFVLLPPVVRVDPKKGQTLRLMYNGDPLPKDRESVFWLNVLEIPPAPIAPEGKNLMQLAFRTRIKLFFRPDALADVPLNLDRKLTWSLAADSADHPMLRVNNPTAYYFSFNPIKVAAGGRELTFDPGMVAPFAQHDFASKDSMPAVTGPAQIAYKWLNDFGAEVAGTTTTAGKNGKGE